MDTVTWQASALASKKRLRKVRLRISRGPEKGRSATFSQGVITVGRRGADFELSADAKISSRHVSLTVEPGGCRLRDLGSKNGTFVGGVAVADALLPVGATFVVGDTTIEVAGKREQRPTITKLVGGIVGDSEPMRALAETLFRIAPTDATVLIHGETGSGKELVADAIHQLSDRAKQPFVILDCGAVPSTLFEARLFGHVAGAFTGATAAARGVFEAANGGTLFLDEIGELPLPVQAKLLRAVQSRTVTPLGSDRSVSCDVRLIAATHRDLEDEMTRGRFRADLFYRLAVALVDVPPLRQRTDDIELLVEHFAREAGRQSADLGSDFISWARRYPWPGNVRELENAVTRALSVPAAATYGEPESEPEVACRIDLDVGFREAKEQLTRQFDRAYVTALLDHHQWNISASARAAGLDRMSIYKLLRRLGISKRPS